MATAVIMSRLFRLMVTLANINPVYISLIQALRHIQGRHIIYYMPAFNFAGVRINFKTPFVINIFIIT